MPLASSASPCKKVAVYAFSLLAGMFIYVAFKTLHPNEATTNFGYLAESIENHRFDESATDYVEQILLRLRRLLSGSSTSAISVAASDRIANTISHGLWVSSRVCRSMMWSPQKKS